MIPDEPEHHVVAEPGSESRQAGHEEFVVQGLNEDAHERFVEELYCERMELAL